MKKDLIKFYAIKLLLIFIVAVCAAVLTYMVSTVVRPFDGIMYRAVICGIPLLFFLYFMYTVESRIRVPQNQPLSPLYFILFSLREASVYFVFLLPLTFIYLASPDFIVGKGILTYFFAPHSIFLHVTENAFVNLFAMTVIFGAVAFAAHFVQSKHPAPVSEPAEEDADTEKSETDDIDDGE